MSNRVGLLQMCSSMSVEDNLDYIAQIVQSACEQEVDLLILPENFAAMGRDDTAEFYGEGPIQQRISALAQSCKLWIIAGTMPIKTAGSKVRASCIVYDDKGQHVARYDKIHLFDVCISAEESHQESARIERGEHVVVTDTPVGKIGLTICYDVRFPELYQQLLFKGAQLFSIPSAFTAITGLAHWEVLLRARAVENLSYVLAPNQCGYHQNGRHTYGHSMVVDPWGRIVAEQLAGCGLVISDIDLPALQQLRQHFPCVDHHILAK